MKNCLIALLGVAFSLSSTAQVVKVVSTEQLLRGVESGMYHPTVSPDGENLLFTSENFTGLKVYNFKDNVTTKISDEPRAGFMPQFVKNEVVFNTRAKGNFGKNAVAAKRYTLSSDVKKLPVTARTEGSVIYITKNGVEKGYTPVESYAGYLWESVSPDATKVMFYAAGKGIVITDLNGKVLSMPGNFENPVWLGNDAIVAMHATDDGHQFSSSQIVALSLDGKTVQELTSPESMTMYPTTTADGKTIIYGTIDGRLYKMNVQPLK